MTTKPLVSGGDAALPTAFPHLRSHVDTPASHDRERDERALAAYLTAGISSPDHTAFRTPFVPLMVYLSRR